MVLRVDVVAAALDAVYGAGGPSSASSRSPRRAGCSTRPLVEELAREPRLTLLSSRFEGFDERIVEHLATDAVSIGPYVLSGGELPAMVLLDAVARRLPGALAAGSGEHESFSEALDGGVEYPHYTRPAEFRGWRVPDVLLSGDHARIDGWRHDQSRLRTRRARVTNPLDHLTGRLPHGWRIAVDWVITIVGRDRDRARRQGVRRQPVPDPVLVDGADAALRAPDRRLPRRALLRPRAREPARVQGATSPSAATSSSSTPRPEAAARCGAGGTFVKRLIVLPGETWRMDRGVVYINGRRLVEPYIERLRRGDESRPTETVPPGRFVMLGDNRTHSCDSRVWGTVPRENLIGKVFAVYWPPSRLGLR